MIIRIFKKFTWRRFKNMLYYIRHEGIRSVLNRSKNCLRNREEDIEPLHIKPIEKKERLEDCEPLNFPEAEPLVSIVIPVYNEFSHTYACLQSILENTKEIPYEIILGDDCSDDLTKDIAQIVSHIKIIRNTENMRFLKNCNQAATKATGKYIVFLNNDTTVQEGWLSALLSVMKSDENVGLVGSKLVYPDGTLQEAGGIIWRDASGWNYGRGKNPQASEYNYRKEADYISGAAIMIRSSLWNQIGGFDERFAPAYYEDSDLAFEVRKAGYQVVYQPASVVIHYEGISNGSDLSAGQKAFQIRNQKIFYDKWKDILEKEHFENAQEFFLARDRSRDKKHILVVDHHVPFYDQDAGSKCTYMYIKLFVKLGMKVTFIGANYFRHEPYATELMNMGIEVLYGNWYYENWSSWIKENGHYFDYAYLNRPHIAIEYIDVIKAHSKAKIIYFGHDLHFLRELRQYEISQDKNLLHSSQEWKKKEFSLFKKADVIHVVGSYEQSYLQKEFPEKPIRNIPLYIYEDIGVSTTHPIEERKNLLYVGGFGHPPNYDAVLWFAREVFPKITKVYPDIKWYVVGSNPPEEIQELNSRNIDVKGFVTDEELNELYATCRMAVVPLRYGAGVKGKVVEAVYHQIPLITTFIGAEGISVEENAFIIADGEDQMAREIIQSYEDFERLKRISENCKLLIANYYTIEAAKEVLELDFK